MQVSVFTVITPLALMAALVGGCAHYVPPSDKVRADSFQRLLQTQADGEPLQSFLFQRTAVIINGSLTVAEVAVKGQKLAIEFKPEPGKIVNGPSHAVAIDARGYFLTAAHCLNEPVIYLIYAEGGRACIAIPRVVCKNESADAAIIHVDADLDHVFTWSDSAALAPSQTAVAVGSSSGTAFPGTLGFFAPACMAGHLLSTTTSVDGSVQILHDVALRPGDSGGPLTNQHGELLGLDTGIAVSWTGHLTSRAVRPDPAWVARMISDDLRKPRMRMPAIPATLKDPHKANMIVTLVPGPNWRIP